MADEAKNEDGSVILTDEKGRLLTVKEPDFLQEARITRLCGDASTNVGFMYAYVFPAIWVVKIDDNPVPFPTTYREVEGVIQRVGREGCSIVLGHMKERQDAGKHLEDVKN